MLEQAFSAPENIWNKLNLAWISFFILMGCANLIAMNSLSCSQWVSFKLYGLTGLMFMFVLGQGVLLSKYIDEEKT